MKLSIDKWSEADIPLIAEIEKRCIKKPWTEKMLWEEYNNPFFECITCRVDGDFAGYVNYHKITDEYHIANIAVSENFRRKGIACALIEEVVCTAKNNNINGITLEVGENNAAAVNLYKKLGFISEGKRKNYYGKEAALIMWKYL